MYLMKRIFTIIEKVWRVFLTIESRIKATSPRKKYGLCQAFPQIFTISPWISQHIPQTVAQTFLCLFADIRKVHLSCIWKLILLCLHAPVQQFSAYRCSWVVTWETCLWMYQTSLTVGFQNISRGRNTMFCRCYGAIKECVFNVLSRRTCSLIPTSLI